jgi:hypothetical protein
VQENSYYGGGAWPWARIKSARVGSNLLADFHSNTAACLLGGVAEKETAAATAGPVHAVHAVPRAS